MGILFQKKGMNLVTGWKSTTSPSRWRYEDNKTLSEIIQ